ncbi:uncharacterized protein AAGF69_010874 isoform 1-T1 [Amazona ochrocephala]
MQMVFYSATVTAWFGAEGTLKLTHSRSTPGSPVAMGTMLPPSQSRGGRYGDAHCDGALTVSVGYFRSRALQEPVQRRALRREAASALAALHIQEKQHQGPPSVPQFATLRRVTRERDVLVLLENPVACRASSGTRTDLQSVLRIPSEQGCHKAFSTRLPHLAMLSLLVSTSAFAYLKPPSISFPPLDLVLSVLYSVLPPAVNTLIQGHHCIPVLGARTDLLMNV